MPPYMSTNFTIVKGDSKTIRVTVKDPDGVVVPITSYEGRFTIKKKPDDTTYILRKATSGITGGSASQMAIYSALAGQIDIFILKTDLVDFATATLTAVAAASILNNEGFTLVDTLGNSVVFKFSKDGGAVTGQTVTVAITTGMSADQIAAAINASVTAYATFRSTVLLNVVSIVQAISGEDGNADNSDTVINVGFSITSFVGGSDEPLAGLYYYDVELQAPTSENISTVVPPSAVTIADQITNWKGI